MMFLEKLNHNIDMSKLTKEEKGTICFEAVQTLGFATKRIDEAWREVGKLLSWIKKTKIYKFYSDDINGQMQTDECTWSKFIKSIDLGFDVAHSDNLIRVSDTFEPYLEDRHIKYARLLEAKPVVTEENREEILNAAEHLPLEGWKDTIREQKGKVLVEACLHDELENYGRCKACGKWIKC